MKKITKYLIVPLFSIFAFFLLFNTNVSAEMSGGVVVDPGNGDITTNPSISGEELYEQCHTYITTNIISVESLTEALNGKIYGDFTQEDCMEMINIASKREVIKNMFDVSKYISKNNGNASYRIINDTIQFTCIQQDCYFGEATRYVDGQYYIEVLENTSYTITFNFNTSGYVSSSYVSYVNSNNEVIKYQSITNGKTFVTPNGTDRIFFRFGINHSSINYVGLTFILSNIQLEKGSSKTPYVSYDYHREYYEEGIDYADGRVNTNSTSYTQGVTDADNRVNTDSVNYKSGVSSGYEKATKDGKSLGTFIPNLLGGFGSFFLTILNIDILGFNLLTVFGIIVAVAGVIIILKMIRG